MKKSRKPILITAMMLLLTFLPFTACQAKDNESPRIMVGNYNDVGIGNVVNIISAEAKDNVDKNIIVQTKVVSPSGNEVIILDNSFTANEIGIYTIIYLAKDNAGNSTKEVRTFNATSLLPIIEIGEYKNAIKLGQLFDLPLITINDYENTNNEYTISMSHEKYSRENIINNFLPQFPGEHIFTVNYKNSNGSIYNRTFNLFVEYALKEHKGIDGDISDEIYSYIKFNTSISDYDDSNRINISTLRGKDGLYLSFIGNEDETINNLNKIEISFDSNGQSLEPSLITSRRITLYKNGEMKLFVGQNKQSSWSEISINDLEYDLQPVCAIGSSAKYIEELFVPYEFINIRKNQTYYISFAMDINNELKQWHYLGNYVDSNIPIRYVEITPQDKAINSERLYFGEHVDGNTQKAIYYGSNVLSPTIGGSRNLESAKVRVYRGDKGLYVAFEVDNDKCVNSNDGLELYITTEAKGDTLFENKNFMFSMSANGVLKVFKGNNDKFVDFIPEDTIRPNYVARLNNGTTINDNSNIDNGYRGELFISYSFFQKLSDVKKFNKDTRFGVTFGLNRVNEINGEIDWDGWNSITYSGGTCNPIIPSTYAVSYPNGRIVDPMKEPSHIGEPTDPSVDGKLDEKYWYGEDVAKFVIEKTDELDGLVTLIYHDEEGLRISFIGDAHKITEKDVIMLYINTYNQSYKIGSDYLDDYYFVNGQYPNTGDFRFQIGLDRTIEIRSGLYKDWYTKHEDLSSISYEVSINNDQTEYIVEMYVPYSFLKSEGHVVTKNDTLGVSVRLAGENNRGSVIWNNLYFGGIYVDSESPASYVRMDKNGKLYAALDNDGDIRIDGIFDESIYESKKAEVAILDNSIDIYRCDKGIIAKMSFGQNSDVLSIALNTVNHGRDKPYVYDYKIMVSKNGKLSFSWGNSHDFYNPEIYAPYCSPRVAYTVLNGKVCAELYIPYEYLSRYNTSGTYVEKGYMEINNNSLLRVAFNCISNGKEIDDFYYNSTNYRNVKILNPTTYLDLVLK